MFENQYSIIDYNIVILNCINIFLQLYYAPKCGPLATPARRKRPLTESELEQRREKRQEAAAKRAKLQEEKRRQREEQKYKKK